MGRRENNPKAIFPVKNIMMEDAPKVKVKMEAPIFLVFEKMKRIVPMSCIRPNAISILSLMPTLLKNSISSGMSDILAAPALNPNIAIRVINTIFIIFILIFQ
ncbi:hypothetical protein AAGF08_19315 [Algoriphagus sp. SE2]|uniref:hypothetical protein n=1 Tax=Algoriphagus sp. SE2 TaxID=3141536 RepID=UPI0031CD23AC